MSFKPIYSRDYDKYGYYEEKYDDCVVCKHNKYEEKTKIGVKKISYKQVNTLKSLLLKKYFTYIQISIC